jgi:predicted nuclease with TOPRIM domain
LEECIKLKKLNKNTFKKINEVELEKENLLAKLDDSHAVVDKLKLEIAMLNEQNKSLENDLKDSKDHLERIL